ncbi:MAG: hypothetical protein R2942_14025 [Ignavibacteria bacterium]
MKHLYCHRFQLQGQNGLNQAKEFSNALNGLTGIILTKLDGARQRRHRT